MATTSGRYVRRATDVNGKPRCLPILPHEVHARVAELGLRDLSAFPLADVSVQDLDSTELDRFRRLAEGSGDGVPPPCRKSISCPHSDSGLSKVF